jgi:arylformamidase
MPIEEYRAQFDATVTFSNGGALHAEAFRVDVPSPDTSEQEVAALFVASLGLLMVDRVQLRGLRVFPEAHKGTRGGPGDLGRGPVREAIGWRWVELSHVITAGMTTYPGLPAPEVTPYLTREASREVYAPGTEFAIDRVTMVGNTGTYLDSPYHRYADGIDLAGLPLTSLADLPAVVVRTIGSGTASGSRAVDVGALGALEVSGRAVLLHTGGDRHWGTRSTLGTPPTSPRRVPAGSWSTTPAWSASTR